MSDLSAYRAIFCVDPGGHTGVAMSYVPMLGTIKASLVARLAPRSLTIEGEETVQIRALYTQWIKFKREAVGNKVPLTQIELVFEDFTLRGGMHAAGKDGTSPERITWGFEGYRMGRRDAFRRAAHYNNIIFQQAGQAHTMATRDRLEAWGCWVKGREHERMAYAHMALRVSRLLRRAR